MAEQAIQWQIVDRWLASLDKISDVAVVWIEGSLVGNRRPVPGADIDIRIGLEDDAYERLWGESVAAREDEGKDVAYRK